MRSPSRVARLRGPALFLVGLISTIDLSGCTKANPRDCADGTCTDPAFPFCDQDGAISGHAQTCLAVDCTPGEFAACNGTQLLSCNANGNDYNITQCERGCDTAAAGCVSCVDNTQCANPTPTCDSTTHACRTCQTDDDCSSELCDTRTNTCVDPASILYVAPDGLPGGECGSQATPCGFDRAFTMIDGAHHIIKLRSGDYTLTRARSFTTKEQEEIYIDGFGATIHNPLLTGVPFEVLGSGRLRIVGLAFQEENHATDGFVCGTFDTPLVTSMEVEDVSFIGGNGVVSVFSCVASFKRVHFNIEGIAISVIRGGIVTADQCLFESTPAGRAIGFRTIDPTVAPHGQMHVKNSVFRNLSQDAVLSEGIFDVQFSTFINIATQIDCTNEVMNGLNGQRIYSNSVFFNTDTSRDIAVDSPCTFHYSIMSPQVRTLRQSDNLLRNIGPKLADPANGDYHLLPGSKAIDAADPAATELHDFEGAKRPDGVLRDLGAFEFHL